MSLREVIERIRSSPEPPNEETAKFRILAPILTAVGWNTESPEVLLEHPVGGKGGGRADFALQADGRLRALIEAKAPGSDLDKHVKQVLVYAFHEGVDICALTNGLHWRFYLPREKGPPQERVFADLHCGNDPVDQLCDDLNTFLGRASLLSGQAEERAKQVRQALQEAARLEQEMPEIWRRMLDEADDELIELVGQRVYDKLSLRPSREQIVAAMRNRPIPPGPGPKPDPPPPSNPTAVELWGARYPVRLHSDILVAVVEALYKRHRDTFERTAGSLRYEGCQYVSTDRQRVAGTNPKRTPSGLYLWVRGTADIQRRRWVSLLEAFGYNESDLQLLYGATKPKKSLPPGRTPCPTAIRLWNEHHPTRRHYEILTTLVAELHKRHPGSFDKTVEQLKGKRWQYVSLDPQRVYDERRVQIPSGHYVDINVSAKDVALRCRRLLQAFGYSESDLEYLHEG